VTIPSEAELIEMEHRAIYLADELEWYIADQVASDVGKLVSLIRSMREGGRVPLPDSTPSAH
jgi:hypothetical protein